MSRCFEDLKNFIWYKLYTYSILGRIEIKNPFYYKLLKFGLYILHILIVHVACIQHLAPNF